MATVTGMTAAAMQAIADGVVVSGAVNNDGYLILTKFDGSTVNAGYVKGAKGSDAPPNAFERYDRTKTYSAYDLVSFAGRVYRALRTNSAKRPPFYTEDWAAVSSTPNGWVQTDPYFLRSDWDGWEFFWAATGVTRAFTTVAGEFVTGNKALKLTIPAGGNQRIFIKDMNLVGGGERVQTRVNARFLTAGANITMVASLYQATQDGNPEPFGSDSHDVNAVEGDKTLTSSWVEYVFNNTATFGRPQARANVVIRNNGASPAEVLVDSIYTSVLDPIVKTHVSRGTTSERNAAFGVPSTSAERVALANQQPAWYNTTLGWWESYYAVKGTAGLSVRGLKSGHSPGWYPMAGSNLSVHRGMTKGFEWMVANSTHFPTLGGLHNNYGGFTSYYGDGVIVPYGGIYRCQFVGYFTGGTAPILAITYAMDGAGNKLLSSLGNKRSADADSMTLLVGNVERTAGSPLTIALLSSNDLNTYGTTGYDGTRMDVEYVRPPLED